MTTIVYDQRTHSIARDSRLCRGDVIMSDSFDKSRMTEDALYYYAGSVADMDEFMKADKTFGVKCPTAESVSVLKVKNNRVYECGFDSDDGYWEVECLYSVAIGSGANFALAAIDCGKNARDAVEIAAKRDPFTGGTIRTLEIGERILKPNETLYV